MTKVTQGCWWFGLALLVLGVGMGLYARFKLYPQKIVSGVQTSEACQQDNVNHRKDGDTCQVWDGQQCRKGTVSSTQSPTTMIYNCTAPGQPMPWHLLQRSMPFAGLIICCVHKVTAPRATKSL